MSVYVFSVLSFCALLVFWGYMMFMYVHVYIIHVYVHVRADTTTCAYVVQVFMCIHGSRYCVVSFWFVPVHHSVVLSIVLNHPYISVEGGF